MRKLTRRSFLAASAMATAAITSQWGGIPKSWAQSGVVNLYSSRHYNTDDELYDGFTRETGIQVNLIEGSADELLERIIAEGANSPADIFITVDASRIWRAQQANLLMPINSSILNDRIPANLRADDGSWYSFSKRARVIMYNRDRVNPADLSTYENLADPRWRNQVLVRTSTNVYNISLVASMIEGLGAGPTEEWCRGLVDNFARPPEGNDTAQIRAVAAGVGSLAIANSYYLARLANSDDLADQDVAARVGIFFPNQRDRGTHVNISGGGVLRTAPNSEAAIAFLEYLSSPTAQAFFAEGNNEYPVVEGTPLDPVLASYGNFREDPIDVTAYGRNSDEALRVSDRAGWI